MLENTMVFIGIVFVVYGLVVLISDLVIFKHISDAAMISAVRQIDIESREHSLRGILMFCVWTIGFFLIFLGLK